MKVITGFALIIILISCSSTRKITVANESDISVKGKLWASIFQQRAAEYKALCFQSYNIAKLRLDEALQQQHNKPLAIISDIDETILDNSPYAVHQSLINKDYDDASWMQWTSLADADTLAGGPAFFKYAAGKNVEVFYITNRDVKERAATLINLHKYNFPFADSAHLFLKSNESSKESRRQIVLQQHEIILLLGDNLADFSSLFDHKAMNERLQNTQQSAAEFGKRFIVFPNTNYGDWESSLYNYNFKLSGTQKDSLIIKSLRSY